MIEFLAKEDVLRILRRVASRMKERSDELRILDAATGDGDLGFTVTKGFTAIEDKLSQWSSLPLDGIFKTAGMTFNNAAASTFGVFFATANKGASKVLAGKDNIGPRDLCDMFRAAVQDISKRGKAKVGDKTILDALVPASDAACEAAKEGACLYDSLSRAVAAARDGAEGTKGMLPRKGRARWLGEKTKDVQDPGATFVYMFLEESLAAMGEDDG